MSYGESALEALTVQLREAEARRAEAERAHQDALSLVRATTATGATRTASGETLEALQSRTRELEKKAALETVR